MLERQNQRNILYKPKITHGKLDSFLRCLGINNRRDSYYKNFIWGNEGRNMYLNKYYPKMLINIIKNFREDTLFIVVEDSDNRDLKKLELNWNNITENTLKNKNNFQSLPLFNQISEKTLEINIRNNCCIQINYNTVPQNLEYQIAYINMLENDLEIAKDIQANSHSFLDEVAKILNIEIVDLIKETVNLLIEERWLKDIITLINEFEEI